jgi:exosortase
MRALSEVRDPARLPGLPRLTWLSCLAVSALFVPTFYKLFAYGWDNADYSHGPLILAAFCWLIWRKRDAILAAAASDQVPPLSRGRTGGGWGSATVASNSLVNSPLRTQPEAAALPHPHPGPPLEREGENLLFAAGAMTLLLFGCACYAIGSGHGSMAIESFSMVPVLLGAAGFLLGKRALKALLFPVCFLLFLVPPPLVVTDLLTAPLKMLVATASASSLKAIGYLVTRNGATILMSDYSITVGDPCSGMRSLIALMSVGALYAHLLKSSKIKKATLFFSTIPISVFANIVRLMVLCLITFHFGEAAAEGFLHKFSGFVLFVVSLVSLFLLDLALHRRVAK